MPRSRAIRSKPCLPPATTRSRASAIAPCCSLAGPRAGGGAPRSRQPTCAYLRSRPNGEYSYELVHSKTNQSGEDRPENEKPVVGAAADAPRDWLEAAGIKEGAIFRRVRRGGHAGDQLSAAAVREIVRKRCALAGIEGDYSAHLLRSGFVTEAKLIELPIADTIALSGHRSVQSLLGYVRGGTNRRVALRLLA